jgi:hypothetical protein
MGAAGKPLTVARPAVQDRRVKAVLSLLVPGAVVVLSSCADMNKPLEGGYDPLDSPGSRRNAPVVDVTGPAYTPGQWLETTIPSTAFYNTLPSPRSNEQPSKTLASGTVLKVIATEGTYVQVELESGEVGYVPSIMVAEKPVAGQVPIVPVGPDGLVPDAGFGGTAPEPEIPALDVQPADGGPPGKIDPDSIIE